MSFDKLVEEKIREAMANGEFDNLAGRGKPLDLDAYFAAPEDVRIAYSMLKSAGFIPQEAQLLKEIESLKDALENCPREDEKKKIKKMIDEKLLNLNLLLDQYKRRPRPRS
jgi:DNA-binding transcriptional regulator GbsR (MarR family)